MCRHDPCVGGIGVGSLGVAICVVLEGVVGYVGGVAVVVVGVVAVSAVDVDVDAASAVIDGVVAGGGEANVCCLIVVGVVCWCAVVSGAGDCVDAGGTDRVGIDSGCFCTLCVLMVSLMISCVIRCIVLPRSHTRRCA